LFAKTPTGKIRAVRKAGKTRAETIVRRRETREATAQHLMKMKRKRGIAPK
jgi:hypothetical protein